MIKVFFCLLGFPFLVRTIPRGSFLQCGVGSGKVGSLWDVYEGKTLPLGPREPVLKHDWTRRGFVDEDSII